MAICAFDHTSTVDHIERVMNWPTIGATSRQTSGRELLDNRESLSISIFRAVGNRRGDGRLAIAGKRNGVAQQDWVLVNMSQTGMAIRVWGRAPFARGEKFTISLRSGATRAEVEGRVCWTRSSWHGELTGPERRAYCQTAGFVIDEAVSTEQEGPWQALHEIAFNGSDQLEIGLVLQLREPRRDRVVVPFRLRAASS